MKAYIYNSTFPQTKKITRTHLHYKRDCTTKYVDIKHEIEKFTTANYVDIKRTRD